MRNTLYSLDQPALGPLHRALDFAAGQALRLVDAYPGYTPMYTVGGRWHREGERWTHWCEGFYPGIFWLLHQHTGLPSWRSLAERYTLPLAPRRHDRTVHDLGFLFLSTYLRWYQLTGEASLREVLIEAGRTLALRRQQGGYLASFLGPQSLFIDIMMNVPLLFWAANETGDDTLRSVALEHCHTTARTLVRPDGSTAHEGIFDVCTGQFLHQSTQQGLSAGSTWSRGLAWALYGFTTSHRLSGETAFLDTARRCAHWYLRHTAEGDAIPPWDFDLPEAGARQPDSSAAAIAASGLWDLAARVEDATEQQRYCVAALRTLGHLCAETFLPIHRPEWEGILLHGVYHYHKGLGVDESVAWGDHFFVEALVKVLGDAKGE